MNLKVLLWSDACFVCPRDKYPAKLHNLYTKVTTAANLDLAQTSHVQMFYASRSLRSVGLFAIIPQLQFCFYCLSDMMIHVFREFRSFLCGCV